MKADLLLDGWRHIKKQY